MMSIDWTMMSAIGTLLLGAISVIVLSFAIHQNKISIEHNKKTLEISMRLLQIEQYRERPFFIAPNIIVMSLMNKTLNLHFRNVAGKTGLIMNISGFVATDDQTQKPLQFHDMEVNVNAIVHPGTETSFDIDVPVCDHKLITSIYVSIGYCLGIEYDGVSATFLQSFNYTKLPQQSMEHTILFEYEEDEDMDHFEGLYLYSLNESESETLEK